VGRPGRTALSTFLAGREFDFAVANCENAAGGFGLTRRTARELLEAGLHVITSGNHIWRHRDILEYMEEEGCPVLRPANYPADNPGKGFLVKEVSGARVMVINLQGRLFMPSLVDCPFRTVDAILRGNRADVILVDFHAEATSEKQVMARYLDGRVTAVVGTHTHVLTADAGILPGGTAFITDLGMCGSAAGVIGMNTEEAMSRFTTGRQTRLKVAEGDERVNGLRMTLNENGKVEKLELVDGET